MSPARKKKGGASDEERALPPASPRAVMAGCTCDKRKNRDGEGAGMAHGGHVLYVINARCPLHKTVQND